MFICKMSYKACKKIVRDINLSCLNKVLQFWYHDQFSGFGYLKCVWDTNGGKSNCITFSKTKVLA